VKLVRWSQPEQLQKLLLAELVAELGLQSMNDEVGFETVRAEDASGLMR